MGKRQHQIDTIRVVAMVMVFMNHAILIQNAGDWGSRFFDRYCSYGLYAVEFFIVLSGTLASYNYHPFDIKDRKQYWGYVARKVTRLLPVHWLCLLAFLPMSFAFYDSAQVWKSAFMSAFLLQSLAPSTVMAVNGPAWTISVLMIFYLLTPLAMNALSRIRKPFIYVALAMALLVAEHFWSTWLRDSFPTDPWYYHSSPHARIFTYAIGLTLGCIIRTIPPIESIRRPAWTMLEIAVSGGCIAVGILLYKQYLCVYSMLVLLIYVMWWGKGRLSILLGARWLGKVSNLSYCFYLIHFLFINLSLYIYLKTWGNISSIKPHIAVALTLASLALSVFGAWALHRYVEKSGVGNRLLSIMTNHNLQRQ